MRPPAADAHPKRILQVIDSLHLGGAERVALHLAKELTRRQVEVHVCCTKFRGALADEATAAGVPVHVLSPGRGLQRYAVSWQLRSIVRRVEPGIVHTHGLPALLHTGPAGFLRQLPPWVHTFHFGNYPHLPARSMQAERFFARAVKRLIAVSHSQKDALIRWHGFSPDRVDVITNGVAMRPEPTAEERERVRREVFGIAPGQVLVGCIAVLTEQKGIPYLLAAARLLREQAPALRFAVVGGGPLESRLRAEAASTGVNDVVTFTGWRTDALDLLPAIDVFVMPSLWEAMPMVLLEAMAGRRAVVATDVGDNSRVIAHERSGLIVPPRDAPALADAILRLGRDEAARTRFGDAARREFEGRFTVDQMVSAYERLYASM